MKVWVNTPCRSPLSLPWLLTPTLPGPRESPHCWQRADSLVSQGSLAAVRTTPHSVQFRRFPDTVPPGTTAA